MIHEYIVKISDEIMEEEIADKPQELIRCKDCKHLLEYDTGGLECEIKSGWFPVTPKWYCADGERKSD